MTESNTRSPLPSRSGTSRKCRPSASSAAHSGDDVRSSSAYPSSTIGDEKVNTEVDEGGGTLRSMTGKPRKAGESVQLQRFRWLIMQLERSGHPAWGVDNLSQAELSRRTGLTKSYINSILHPDRGGNRDIGSSIVARMCDAMGLDVRYFYDKYDGERPFLVYLANKREERRFEGLAAEQRDIRAEFATLRAEFAERDARQARRIAELEAELAKSPRPRAIR